MFVFLHSQKALPSGQVPGIASARSLRSAFLLRKREKGRQLYAVNLALAKSKTAKTPLGLSLSNQCYTDGNLSTQSMARIYVSLIRQDQKRRDTKAIASKDYLERLGP